MKYLGIKGLEKAVELKKAIDFMILQSVSRGMSGDGRYLNKLHSLIIGPPASGKKLLTMIAKILNPISFEISSNSFKTTSAGLIGSVETKRGGKKISRPGYLPLASDGIVCIQDFHELTKKKNGSELMASFSQFMEERYDSDLVSQLESPRLINSIELYAKAIACSKLKNEVDKLDIDEAFSFIDYKADFLMNYKESNSESNSSVTAKKPRHLELLELLTDKFKSSYLDEIFSKGIFKVNKRSLIRDLDILIDTNKVERIKHGEYKVIRDTDS